MRIGNETGSAAEDRAAEYLEQKGYEILARNFVCREGELDLVARSGDTLVFVEVKYRRNTVSGTPAEAVDFGKIRRLGLAAAAYLARNGGWDGPRRFDLIGITGLRMEHLRHMENAFLPPGLD